MTQRRRFGPVTRSAGRGRAFSLIEIVLGCVLVGLLFTILFSILVPSLRSWRARQLQSEIQQSALVGVTRIAHELRMSTVESVSLLQASYFGEDNVEERKDVVACLSAVDTNGLINVLPDASLPWQKRLIFYLDAPRQELRCQQLPYSSGEAPALEPLDFAADPERDSVIARNIYSLVLLASPRNGTGFNNPIVVQIGAAKEGVRYSLETSVSARHPVK